MDKRLATELLIEDHQALSLLIENLLNALHGLDVRAAYEHLDVFWARLAMHIRAENLWLFPAIEKLATDRELSANEEIESALARLREDHDFFMRELAVIVNEMRELMNTSSSEQVMSSLSHLRDEILTIRTRLEEHDEIEEKKVYNLATSMLDGSARDEIAARVRREISNLPPRFENVN